MLYLAASSLASVGYLDLVRLSGSASYPGRRVWYASLSDGRHDFIL
jgi:hypothetical protein